MVHKAKRLTTSNTYWKISENVSWYNYHFLSRYIGWKGFYIYCYSWLCRNSIYMDYDIFSLCSFILKQKYTNMRKMVDMRLVQLLWIQNWNRKLFSNTVNIFRYSLHVCICMHYTFLCKKSLLQRQTFWKECCSKLHRQDVLVIHNNSTLANFH